MTKTAQQLEEHVEAEVEQRVHEALEKVTFGDRLRSNITAIGATLISLIAIITGGAQLHSYIAKQEDLDRLTLRVRLNEKEREYSKVSTHYYERTSLYEKSPSIQLKESIDKLFAEKKAVEESISSIKKQL